MQSLNIKRLAKPLSWAIASVILIDCPTAAAAATILSDYSVPTVLTDCSISTTLDLYYC